MTTIAWDGKTLAVELAIKHTSHAALGVDHWEFK